MRLKAAREKCGLTQIEVADRLGVTKATVSAWETGVGDPGVYRLRELVKLYGVAASAILWEKSLSAEAVMFAEEFDSLDKGKQETFRAIWVAYVLQQKGIEPQAKPSVAKVHHHKGVANA